MKKVIIPFLFVFFFTLTSCSTQWGVVTYSDPIYTTPVVATGFNSVFYPQVWVDVYDFNRIHWLYLNHPNWVWGNYWNHRFFIQYRNDCLRRGIYMPRYRNNFRFTQDQRRYYWNQRNTNIRRNSGRSNLTYNRNTRYRNNTVTPQRRTFSSTRSTNTRVQRNTTSRTRSYNRSTPVRRSSSVRSTPSRSYNRSTPTRSYNRSSRGSIQRSSPARSSRSSSGRTSSRRSSGRQ